MRLPTFDEMYDRMVDRLPALYRSTSTLAAVRAAAEEFVQMYREIDRQIAMITRLKKESEKGDKND